MKRLAGKKSPVYLPQMGVAATEWEQQLPPGSKINCKKGLSRTEIVHVLRGGREQTAHSM